MSAQAENRENSATGRSGSLKGILTWRRETKYSMRAVGTGYRVTCSRVLDGWKFSAWHGPLLREQPRESFRMPTFLGVFEDLDKARTAAELDLAQHPERAPKTTTDEATK
jgi:hypothetical protein